MALPRGTMDAVLLLGHGGPEMLEYRRDVPTPEPGHDDVLIAVRAAGVNNTDINTRIGWYAGGSWAGDAVTFPRDPGRRRVRRDRGGRRRRRERVGSASG